MVPLQIQVCTHSKAARTIASDLIPMSNGNNRIHSWISCSCHGYQPLMFCGFRLQTKMTILSLSKGGAARPSGPAKAGPLFGQVLTFFLFLFQSLTEIRPHQPGPSFSFPKRSFGKTKVVQRSFQANWFRSWNWIHYEEAPDTALCFLCSKAIK